MSDPLISSSRRLAAAGRRNLPARAQPTTPGVQVALTQIARAIIGRSSAQDVAQVVVNEVRRVVPADRSAVWLWQPARDTMQLLAVAADHDAFGAAALGLPVGASLPVNDGRVREALERARSVREADLRRNPQQIEQQLAASGLRSRLTVPVLVGEQPIGVLAVSSRECGVYTLEHQRLLEHLTVHLAVGLEQARLTAEARRHEARLLGLQRVAQRLSASVAGEDVLDMVLDEAVRSVGGDGGTLLSWDEERRALTPIRNTVPAADQFTPLRHGHEIAERAVQHGRVVTLPSAASGDDAPAASDPAESGPGAPAHPVLTGAAIGAPLIADGRLLGAVIATTHDPHKRFDAADIQVFELYAGQAAAVCTSVRQFESERRQRRGAEEVARAAAEIAAEIDHERRMQLIVERAVTIVGGVAGGLGLIDPQTGRVVVRASHGYQIDFRGRAVESPHGITQRVLTSRQPVILDDYAREGSPFRDLDPQPYGPAIGVPVSARGEVLGSLVIQAAAGAPRFHPEDISLLQAVADLAAVAVDNARTLAREAEHCRQLDAVRAVTAELTRELDLPSLLDLILLRATEFVRCESAIVMLWDEAGQQLVPTAWCGMDDAWVASTRLRLNEGAAGTAAFQRRGIVVEEYRHWPASILPTHEEDIPVSVMAAPMLYQDRLIGVLTANRMPRADGQPVEPFTARDLELLDVFGGQAAVAVENARLFEQATTAEALRELAQLKAELLNTVSHELRTPLSLIHGYAELLLHRAERLSPAEVAQMSGEIHTSSRTLARLVDDLLDFSQLDRGGLQLRRSAVALNELLEGMVRTFQTQPGGERIRTALEPALLVDADADRLRQVVGNLLTNALDYTVDGPITVRAAHLGEVIQVEVTDEGPGLSSEEVGRVWESFYRGAQAAQLPNRGSGLGLSVVKQLVELHGGSVGVRSMPGHGATFWFTLPPA